jgi:hypothetical protein
MPRQEEEGVCSVSADLTPSVVERLDAIGGDDPEAAHSAADDLLLACVPTDVADAYRRVAERCRWWAAS